MRQQHRAEGTHDGASAPDPERRQPADRQRHLAEQQKQIVRLLLRELSDRVKETPGFELQFSDEVVDYILEKGYNPQYGARPLRRTIQNELEDYLADEYLQGNIRKDDKVRLILTDGKIAMEK